MAGTIFGLPLSQQFTAIGQPMEGCKLYLYLASTTTPAVAFQDYGLTTGLELPWPIVGDANGRIPQFWVDDGAYRARLTDSAGTVQFDLSYVQSIGPSSGTGGGGGGTVDANSVFATGDTLWIAKSGTRAGWVRANARTIGSATSGASERANADCQSLFTYVWNTYSDTLCPVTGGRGVSAAADWSANKPIATLDMRGRTPVGLDDMGNSSASRLSGVTFSTGNATTAASFGGEALHTLSVAEIPDHGHAVTDPGHHHTYNNVSTGSVGSSGPSAGVVSNSSSDTSSVQTGISIQNAGDGGSHNNMQPFALGTWYFRL